MIKWYRSDIVLQEVRSGARYSVTISFPPLATSPGRPRSGELAGNELSVLSSNTVALFGALVEMNCQFCHIGSFAPLRSNTGEMTCADLGFGSNQYLPYLCHLTTHHLLICAGYQWYGLYPAFSLSSMHKPTNVTNESISSHFQTIWWNTWPADTPNHLES